MIQEEDNKRRTDRAWGNLYGRLENEGLLQQEKKRPAHHSGYYWCAGMAAAAILVCLLFYVKEEQQYETFVTQQNDEEFSLVKVLDDGSIVYLGDKTLLQYPQQFDSGKREVRLDGTAFFDIARNLDKPFVIKTDEEIIEVLGTAFEVKCKENVSFELSVQRGRVKVTLKENRKEISVDAGQKVTLGLNKSFFKETAHSGSYGHYFKKIRFKDEPLSNVVKAINAQGNPITLKVMPGAQDRKLTASFDGESSENIAKLICMALSLKYSHRGNMLTIYE